ncbi:unnamed protein product [Symbiodinium necroappetens]|uniref:SGNH hydrolase-type esterase domain-containing protein n=1 Tax=Symbiodinium necroappetens TaxID=1628268 RepID=A0A812NTA6_9DINO|nr:unnamed protein product [Symbiodinium necroappetens]
MQPSERRSLTVSVNPACFIRWPPATPTIPAEQRALQFRPISRNVCSTGLSSCKVHAAEPGKRTPTILCIGDSLTSGSRGSFSYPEELQAMLEQEGIDMKVSNGGNWGDTTDQIRRRLPSLMQSVMSQGGRLAFVLVLAGTNDLLQLPPLEATVSLSIPRIAGKIKEILDIASQAAFHPHVGILSLPPLLSRDVGRLKLNQSLRQLFGAPGLPHRSQVPGAGARFLVDLDTVDAALSTDGVHYGQEGYNQFAKRVMQVILPMLKADAAHRRLAVSSISA